jgi:hypothetical protein
LPLETVLDGELVALVGVQADFEVLMGTLNAPVLATQMVG